MQFDEILNLINDADRPLSNQQLLDLVLPPKIDGSPYSLDEIETVLEKFYQQIEQLQRAENEKFDQVLDEHTQEELRNLCQSLNKTQLDVIKLQCEISQTREQYNQTRRLCESEHIKRRRELIDKEQALRTSLKQFKFKPVQTFFNLFIKHLAESARAFRKLLDDNDKRNLYLQSFDWANYHQVMFLLRACGKTMHDIHKFERLYQSGCNFVDLIFKQPLEEIDFSNYVEFQSTYNLETQLEIVLDFRQQVRCDFGQFQCNEIIHELFSQTDQPIAHELFLSEFDSLRSTTIDFCKLLVDMNVYYIEAHLTDGITIEQLNGGADAAAATTTTTTPPGAIEQTLPAYAFSPQEYITQIGQHLLTLRKQTEQYSHIEGNEPLRSALEYLEQAQTISLVVKSCKTITEIILKCVARHCLRSFVGRTGNSIMSRLTPNGRRQLATDAKYLDNVLEDLGLLGPGEPNYEKFKSLLAH